MNLGTGRNKNPAHMYYKMNLFQRFVNQVLVLFKLADVVLQLLVKPLPRRLSYFSTPDYSDNAYYVYRHALLTRTRLEHVWLLTDMSVAARVSREFEALEGKTRGHSLRIVKRASLRGYWLYLTSRCVFHTHGIYRFVRWTFRREVVCLWHGMPIKSIGRLNHISPNPFPTFGTRHIASSHFFKYIIAAAFRVPPEAVGVCGLPRCDALRADYKGTHSRERIKASLRVPEGKKLVVWLPTFRTEFENAASTRSFLDDLDPKLLATLDQVCARHDCFIIIKLHPFDMLNRASVRFEYRNLRLLKAQEWLDYEIPLYDLLAASDALISDVSSVLIDYLVTTRPIGVLGFDPETYTRDLLYPVEVLFRSTRFDMLTGDAAVSAFFGKIGDQPVHAAENDIASMFYENFAESGAEKILAELGISRTA